MLHDDPTLEQPTIEDVHGAIGCHGLPDDAIAEMNAFHDAHWEAYPMTDEELNELEHRSRFHDAPCANPACGAVLSVANGIAGPVWCPQCIRKATEAANWSVGISMSGKKFRGIVICPNGRRVYTERMTSENAANEAATLLLADLRGGKGQIKLDRNGLATLQKGRVA